MASVGQEDDRRNCNNSGIDGISTFLGKCKTSMRGLLSMQLLWPLEVVEHGIDRHQQNPISKRCRVSLQPARTFFYPYEVLPWTTSAIRRNAKELFSFSFCSIQLKICKERIGGVVTRDEQNNTVLFALVTGQQRCQFGIIISTIELFRCNWQMKRCDRPVHIEWIKSWIDSPIFVEPFQ